MPTGVYPRKDIDERFWSKVQLEDEIFPENGCMLWTGTVIRGYGAFTIGDKMFRAHRWGYERRYGPIAIGLDLDHLCRNRACVNPDHVEQVTRKINIERGDTGANLRTGNPRPWLKKQ